MDTCILDTNPNKVSLKTNNKMAVNAPIPLKKKMGLLSMMIDMVIIIANIVKIILHNCLILVVGIKCENLVFANSSILILMI